MTANALEIIRNEVETNPVVLYMKGSPDFPQCGFSARASQALNACGVGYKAVNVFDDEEIYRQGVKLYANWPTIPQLFIKGELVGGCDIILDLYQSGELEKMLREADGASVA
ncbi:MAG: Grx4 family monothiol glutaredoxin [Salinisphaera sp.]|nr:Grx4 family monothiol glutaredoxin [Salinisphaera sp.]